MFSNRLLSSLPACFVDPIKKQIMCSGISMPSDCAWKPTELLFWHQVLFCEHRTPTVLFLLYYEINMLLKLRFLRPALFIFFATDNNTVNIKGQHTPTLSNMCQNARPHYFLCANTLATATHTWLYFQNGHQDLYCCCCCWLHCKGYLLFSKQYWIFRLSTLFSLSNYKQNKYNRQLTLVISFVLFMDCFNFLLLAVGS